MLSILPTPATNHSNSQFRIPQALEGATHVFVRRDARAPPLTRPYQGPFRVAQSGEKYFEVEVKGKIDKISIDRLKPAFVENSNDTVCYDTKEDVVSPESSNKKLSQPLTVKKRGRPTKAEQEARAEIDRDERLAKAEQERLRQEEYDEEFPPITTRSGRESRPPVRL